MSRERETQINKQPLNNREHTNGYQRGGGSGSGWVTQVTEIKDSTCDEHQVMYSSVESLHCIPETNSVLHVNQLEFI